MTDKWELYNLDEDWSQANDLAAKMPEKLARMKELFLVESPEEQEPADRRRPVVHRIVSPGRCALDALQGMDVYWRDDTNA